MPEAIEQQHGITTVTNSNMKQFVDEKLGVHPPPTAEEVAANEVKAEENRKLAEADEKKRIEDDPTHDVPEVPKDKKSKLNERFSELTTRRKEAEAKAQAESERAAKFEAELKVLKDEREQLAKEAAELKSKYEPPKKELEEPRPDQFTDIAEYSKALKEYVAEQTRKEDAQKQIEQKQKEQVENRTKLWSERQKSFKDETKDYDEVIGNAGDISVSDLIRDTIVESEYGPQLLYYLAKNKDIAVKLTEMHPAKALKEIGKLEDKLGKIEVTEPVVEKPVAKISKAPAPISPIGGGTSTGTSMIDENNNFTGSYEDWKRLRTEGKIKA